MAHETAQNGAGKSRSIEEYQVFDYVKVLPYSLDGVVVRKTDKQLLVLDAQEVMTWLAPDQVEFILSCRELSRAGIAIIR